jgi:organic radical activating enzyme
VIITGGEPLLQQDLLADLATQLTADGYRLEVETNGTILPTPALATAVAQWNVSPKLTSSGNSAAKREVVEALDWFGRQDNAFFKFVVVDPTDIDDVCDLVRRYGIPPARVLLMPEGRDTSTLAARSTWVADACQVHGFRFSPRLHVLLWGDTRGR